MSATLSPELLADLKAKAEAATPGEWSLDGHQCISDPDGRIIVDYSCCSRGEWEADAAYFLAVQPATILALLAEIERRDQGGVVVPREPTEAMLRAGQAAYADGTHVETLRIWAAMLSAAPPASAPETSDLLRKAAQGPRTGEIHTAIMDAIRADVERQFPDAFTEDTDAEIVIPRQSPERTVYVKLDVSSLAEAALAALSQPPQAVSLRECPFCGGKAEIIHLDDGDNVGGSCVCCTCCQASGNVEFGRKENFVKNWNRRITPPSADADKLLIAREALERARAALHDHYVEWDGEPEDAVPLQLARLECDQALDRLSTT